MCRECEGKGIIKYVDFTGAYVMPTAGVDTAINYCPWCGRKLDE